jgi:4-hydroxy 2-oxovalerate aldolase
MKNKINILDCTLRDGGYYNNWDFDINLANEYLTLMSKINVKFVEIGFRTLSENSSKGIFAHSNLDILKKLKIPKEINIGVMVNASEILASKDSAVQLCQKYFHKDYLKRIKFIRFACHVNEIYKMKKILSWFKKKGLIVFVNIMQISEISQTEIKKICNFLKQTNIDIVYLADSLGSLLPNQSKKIFKMFRENWKKDLGIHAHNNLNLALKNSSLAEKEGFSWIDCTVMGMGRGPGNTLTEELFAKKIKDKTYNLYITNFIKKNFLKLKKKYKWGTNKYYKFAAKNKIHPTYIQKMLHEKHYSKTDYKKILYNLSAQDTRKFNPLKIITEKNTYQSKPIGTWKPITNMNGKDILIIGSGNSLRNKKNKIINFVKKNNLVVIVLNTNKIIPENYINFRVACHPNKIIADSFFYKDSKTNLITPLSMMDKNLKNLLHTKNKAVFDYGFRISSKNKLVVKNNYCQYNLPLAIVYSLAICISGRVNKIFLAGFDGYSKNDPFKDESFLFFKKIKKNIKNKIKFITKSNYNL